MKVSVYYFNCDHDITGIEKLVSLVRHTYMETYF